MTRAAFLAFCCALLASVPVVEAAEPAALLFVYFKDNGQHGVFAALSRDGLRWETLNGGGPWVRPDVKDELMRDPHIAQGPDGLYHMVWTWGWTTLRIGHATSKDLVHWSPHQAIDLMTDVPGTRNVWAPEIAWDAVGQQWIIIWSSTVEGRFAETQATSEDKYNHRVYFITTRDFKTFSKPGVFFDPGYSVIDATLLQVRDGWRLFFKDERLHPEKKFILMAKSKSIRGPWTGIGEPITEAWSEGPEAIEFQGKTFLYYDHYRAPQSYRVKTSTDLKTWTDLTEKASLPAGARHGCFVRLNPEAVRRVWPGKSK